MDDVVGEALRRFRAQTLSDTILDSAKKLFWTLATISLVWTMGMLIVRQDIGELLMELIRFIILTGVFYWLLVNASTHQNGDGYVDAIVRSFLQLPNDEPSDMLMVNKGNGILSKGLLVFFEVVLGTEQGGDIDRLVMSAIATLILGICAVIAAQFLLALVLAWVLGYAGIFLLGFGGSRWSSPIAINYYKHVLAVGGVLLALGVVGSVSVSFLQTLDFPKNLREVSRYSYLGLMFGASILMMVLSLKVPQLLYTLITGSTLGLYAGSASAAGMAIATAGSSAYAVASGRFPGGGGAGGGSPGVHPASSGAGSSRTDSVMEAVQRSTSAAGGMSDPFHVGSSSDPFGVPRSADSLRGGRGGSVFGSTSDVASALHTVGFGEADSATRTAVATTLRDATGGPGGDAVSRAFDSGGSETPRGVEGGQSDGSVFPGTRSGNVPSFAPKREHEPFPGDASQPGSMPGAYEAATSGSQASIDPPQSGSPRSAVTSMRSSHTEPYAAAVPELHTPIAAEADGGVAMGETTGMPISRSTSHVTQIDHASSLPSPASSSPISAGYADRTASLHASIRSDDASPSTHPPIAGDGNDMRAMITASNGTGVRMQALDDTSLQTASIVPADHSYIEHRTDDMPTSVQPGMTVDASDMRSVSTTPSAADVRMPTRADTSVQTASMASEGQGPVSALNIRGADVAASEATPATASLSAGRATVDTEANVSGTSPSVLTEDTKAIPHSRTDDAALFVSTALPREPTTRHEVTTQRDADDLKPETGAHVQAHRDVSTRIDTTVETQQRIERVAAPVDVTSNMTQGTITDETTSSDTNVTQRVATHIVASDSTTEGAVPRMASSAPVDTSMPHAADVVQKGAASDPATVSLPGHTAPLTTTDTASDELTPRPSSASDSPNGETDGNEPPMAQP